MINEARYCCVIQLDVSLIHVLLMCLFAFLFWILVQTEGKNNIYPIYFEE